MGREVGRVNTLNTKNTKNTKNTEHTLEGFSGMELGKGKGRYVDMQIGRGVNE